MTREESAGGALLRAGGEICLVQKYPGVWGFPKGHLDSDAPEAAALREVQEETGHQGRIVGPLPTMEYEVKPGVPKLVHMFRMELVRADVTEPDRECLSVAWVPLEEARGLLAHDSEKRVLDALEIPG